MAKELEVLKNNYAAQLGRQPSEEEMPNLREQAWNRLIEKIAYRKQYEKLGLAVTADELTDMVQGENIHPAIKQSFSNPSTNEFDKNLVVRYLKSFDTLPPNAQAAWLNLKVSLDRKD
jgi:peptidyl-prolyl cis-trans isomerase D